MKASLALGAIFVAAKRDCSFQREHIKEHFMRSLLARLVLCGTLAGVGACTANIHDNTINIPNAKVDVSTSADVNNVKPAEPLPLNVMVSNVYLVDKDTPPPPEHMSDAGYLEFFLDSTSSTSLLVTAQTSVVVMIPATTTAGDHKVICRVDKHDGTPTDAEFELSIKVTLSAT